jgi:hydroxymethylpyrimidine/phosphomethylpyrimidine kinase
MERPGMILSASRRPAVLSIAGFDPSSGAGVTADLKVFAAHRLYGLAAITALTVQSTQGVRRLQPVDAGFLAETLACLTDDVEISGIKIGMLATSEIVGVVASFLSRTGIPRSRIVLDPIIRSSSGQALLDSAGLHLLSTSLLPVVGWITPNLDELAALARSEVSGRESIAALARELGVNHPGLNIVVTGGHLNSPDDFLRTIDGTEQWFPGDRIETTATHGTGCTFSSALLSQLIAEAGPAEAVAGAKLYVRSAMQAAYPIGKGHGPLNHLYRLEKQD